MLQQPDTLIRLATGNRLGALLHPIDSCLVVDRRIADDPLDMWQFSGIVAAGLELRSEMVAGRLHPCYVAKGRAVDKRRFVFGVSCFCACVGPLALLHRRDQLKDVASAAVAELVDAQR